MERVNLVFGKEVKIINIAPIENSYASVEKGRKDILTDGQIGDPANCYGGDWAHFYRGVGRRLVIDLEEIKSVDGFDIGFIHDRNAGIYAPEFVKCYLSLDGSRYFEVAEVKAPYEASFSEKVRAVYSADINACRARYIMLEFYVEVNAFCDELRVFGGDCIGIEAELSGKPFTDVYKGCFASRDVLEGIHDIPLLYFGYWPEDERVARLKKDDFLPYLAYIDRDKKVQDTMFDALMFLIVQGRCPSGGCLGYHGAPNYLSDWEYILDELFADGQNLKAYDQAVEELKKTLSLPKDYKHKFYLTAPVPKISHEPFGDLNGDGIEEKLLTTEDCINAYAWFIDEAIKRFKAEHFENIQLDGWFWVNESASRANRDDEEFFATGCLNELHKRNQKCIFIPYFQAGGCEKAEKIGFDCTTMQPGLSFQSVLGLNPEGMFNDFTSLCKKYGFGVELEIHHGVKNEATKEQYGKLFDEYLLGCIRNGMMTETVHTYYQAAGPGVFHYCAHAEDDYQRAIYDKLYKFIKGTLTEEDIIRKTEIAEPTEPETEEVVSAPEEKAEEIIEEIAAEAENVIAEESDVLQNDDVDEEIYVDFEPVEEYSFDSEVIEKKKKKLRKYLVIGAAVAAAAGIAYLISKAFRDKK